MIIYWDIGWVKVVILEEESIFSNNIFATYNNNSQKALVVVSSNEGNIELAHYLDSSTVETKATKIILEINVSLKAFFCVKNSTITDKLAFIDVVHHQEGIDPTVSPFLHHLVNRNLSYPSWNTGNHTTVIKGTKQVFNFSL